MKRAYCVHTGTTTKTVGYYIAEDYTVRCNTAETPYWVDIAWFKSRAAAEGQCRILNQLGYPDTFKVHSTRRYEALEDFYHFVDAE